MLHEIEIKSLLTKEKYDELKKELPKKYKKINEDTITTYRFRPHDIRVRFSKKLFEIVYKSEDPTVYNRKEITINLKSKTDCKNMISLLRETGFKDDPSWIKTKEEFLVSYTGIDYTLSLQFIEPFAYILEAEIMCEQTDDQIHIPNLKNILKELGCEPIDPKDFTSKINEYIKKFSNDKKEV